MYDDVVTAYSDSIRKKNFRNKNKHTYKLEKNQSMLLPSASKVLREQNLNEGAKLT